MPSARDFIGKLCGAVVMLPAIADFAQSRPRRPMGTDSDGNSGTGIDLEDRVSEKLAKPKMYTVFVHNDPITPREFVVTVLTRYFQKNAEQATKIMMVAHTQGMGAVGTYSFEIAEMRTNIANQYSREQGFPLTFSTQEDDAR